MIKSSNEFVWDRMGAANSFDYIVCGTGSSGSALAARIFVLEAGGDETVLGGRRQSVSRRRRLGNSAGNQRKHMAPCVVLGELAAKFILAGSPEGVGRAER
jgi:hypothetical protein